LGEWIAPVPDSIGTLPQIYPPKIEWIASVTKIIPSPPDLIALEIDSMAAETELVAPPVKNWSPFPEIFGTVR
jgi:hypothetical protein